MQSVYVAGAGMTKFGKDPRPLATILREAAQQALADENPELAASAMARHLNNQMEMLKNASEATKGAKS